MTKGPLALILVGGSIATYCVLREPHAADESGLARALARRIGRGLRAALAQGHVLRLLLVTIAVNLPWTLFVLRRDPRFLEFFYVRENIRAFFDGHVHHTQPFYYYAGVLLEAFAPWSLPCVLGIALALRERIRAAWSAPPAGPQEALRGYLGAIVLFTLAFLQLSSAKLASYPLPILPALAILVVDGWRSRLHAPPAWLRWSLLVNALLMVGGGAFYLYGRRAAADELAAELKLHFSLLLVLAALTLLTAGILALRGRFWTGIAASGVALFVVVALGSARLDELAPDDNVRRLAQRIAELEQPGDLVLTTTQFAQDYTLQLRLRQRIGIVGPARELGMGFFAEVTPPSVPIPDNPYGVSAESLPANPWLFTRERLAGELRSQRRVWFIGAPKDVEWLRASGLSLRAIDTAGQACLVTNVP
jgi:4-amino-4-deoxy-L-arabinose transferase-like glycosyltransferase